MTTVKKFIISFFVALLLPLNAQADGGPWGVGLILANPTGFSLKYRASKDTSIDAALGYSLGYGDNVTIHSTYIWEFNESIQIDQIAIGHYFGIGGALHSWGRRYDDRPRWMRDDYRDDDFGLAIRGLAGLNYYFDRPAFELFTELSLNFFFVPATAIDLGLAIGARYYF